MSLQGLAEWENLHTLEPLGGSSKSARTMRLSLRASSLLFKITALLLSLLVCEGISWLASVRLLARRDLLRREFRELRDAVTSEDVSAFRDRLYDRELGWLRRPHARGELTGTGNRRWRFTIDGEGARQNPYRSPREETVSASRVSVYGDSFTFCDEVNDGETWEYYLSELTHSAVQNFGVSAYGPDQALWRLKRNLPRLRTDVVILGVFSADIARLMSMYRPFYLEETGLKVGFKPMLFPSRNGYEALPNPLQKADLREDFLEAYDTATQYDFWYLENEHKPRLRFPYSLVLLRALKYQMLDRSEEEPLNNADARGRLYHILKEFMRLSEEHRFRPVVLFIPDRGDLRSYDKNRGYSYKHFVRALRSDEAFRGVRLIDVLDSSFDVGRFNILPFQGHASPHGNRIIARIVFDSISDLLE